MRGLVLALFLTPAPVLAASLTALGDSFSRPTGISGDGRVIVGYRTPNGGPQEGFVWSSTSGFVGVGDLAGGPVQSIANGVSSDGRVAVGYSTSGLTPAPINGAIFQAFRWDSDSLTVGLGFLAGAPPSIAYAASADGSVIVGEGNNRMQAFRWTAASGMVGLPGSSSGSSALDVSDDGSVIVGTTSGAPVLWADGAGVVNLGDLPGGVSEGQARGVSPDGRVVVGSSFSDAGRRAFKWTDSSGMLALGDLPDISDSVAFDVASDGTVVGRTRSAVDRSFGAVVWTGDGAAHRLYDLLVLRGATNLQGWRLDTAVDISDDGQWIVGEGYDPDGLPRMFLANITPVPVPAAAWLFGGAVVALAGLRRRGE